MCDDFIMLQCPSCGGKLEIGKNVTEYKCENCGMEHLVRYSAGGVTLEAFARCPVCGRNDRAEKVSSIVRSQSSMANILKPPAKPTKASFQASMARSSNWANSCSVLLFLLGAGLFTLLVAVLTIAEDEIGWIIFFIFLSLLVSGVPVGIGLLIRNVIGPKVKARQEAKRQEEEIRLSEINIVKEIKFRVWRSAMERYENLYYCQRDDVVFLPGEVQSASVDNMNDLLFTVEEQERISKQYEEENKRKYEQEEERKRKLDEERKRELELEKAKKDEIQKAKELKRISKQKEKDTKRDSSQEEGKRKLSPKQRRWGVILLGILIIIILGLTLLYIPSQTKRSDPPSKTPTPYILNIPKWVQSQDGWKLIVNEIEVDQTSSAKNKEEYTIKIIGELDYVSDYQSEEACFDVKQAYIEVREYDYESTKKIAPDDKLNQDEICVGSDPKEIELNFTHRESIVSKLYDWDELWIGIGEGKIYLGNWFYFKDSPYTSIIATPTQINKTFDLPLSFYLYNTKDQIYATVDFIVTKIGTKNSDENIYIVMGISVNNDTSSPKEIRNQDIYLFDESVTYFNSAFNTIEKMNQDIPSDYYALNQKIGLLVNKKATKKAILAFELPYLPWRSITLNFSGTKVDLGYEFYLDRDY